MSRKSKQTKRNRRALAQSGAGVRADQQLVVVPQPSEPLVWAAVSSLLAGEISTARTLLQQALKAGVDRQAVARLLLGQASTHLGRAALFADRPERALRQLSHGLHLGVPGGAGLSLDLLIAEAERQERLGATREAVQRWQDIAILLGEHTPEHIYRRLSLAYAHNTQGFGGSTEENHCWGDMHKHDVLGHLHKRLQPALYLEIGVDAGLSLARAQGPAIGVDPRPDLPIKGELGAQAQIMTASSDAFFREQADALLQPRPELVFIDGMHLFEFALRDFMQVERYASPATLVVIDDIFPCHPTQAARRRRSGAWTGDVWKLHRILREQRPDLTLLALNADTTGLLLIAGLDPDNRVLWDAYPRLVQKANIDEPPPSGVIARQGAIPSQHPVVERVLEVLCQARDDSWTLSEVRAKLTGLASEISATEREAWGRARELVDSDKGKALKSVHEHTASDQYAELRVRLNIQTATAPVLKALNQVQCEMPESLQGMANTRKTLIVHIGTHKTGTTSIQQFLRQQAEQLKAEGIYVSSIGTLNARSGHHNIAWDLRGDVRFSDQKGTLSELIADLARCNTTCAIISAEDFEYLTQYPLVLRGFHHAMRIAGWDVRYLGFYRNREDYQESLYMELLKHGLNSTRDEFVAMIKEDSITFNGGWIFYLDHRKIIAGWESAIGQSPEFYSYDEAVNTVGLLPRFLELIGASGALQKKGASAPWLNRRR